MTEASAPAAPPLAIKPPAIQPHYEKTHKGLGLLARIRRDPLGYFMALANRCGSYAWLSLMGSPVLFLNDATAIDYVFTRGAKNYHKGKYNEGLRPVMGNSIFLSEDLLWWRQRRDMAPVFSGRNFTAFTEQIAESVEAMMRRWEPRIAAGVPIDMAAETPWLTFDVILRALYHEDSGEAAAQIRTSLGKILRVAEKRIWSPFTLPMKLAVRMPNYARPLKFLDRLTYELIERRRQNQAYPEDLLSRMLACHGGSREEQVLLRDNILAFMLAGQETTGNAIAWAFHALARHPDARRKLIAEADAVLGGRQPTYETARQLTYGWQVFSEVLRLYPPVWTMSRHAVRADELPLDDGRRLAVPKDATLMLCIHTVHHRPDYWADPEAFDPDRFTPEAIASRHRYAWLPFGGGNRLCLGFRLAELEGILVMALVYRKYDVQLLPGQQIKPEPTITLRADRPMLMRLTPRVGAVARAAAAPRAEVANCPHRLQGS